MRLQELSPQIQSVLISVSRTSEPNIPSKEEEENIASKTVGISERTMFCKPSQSFYTLGASHPVPYWQAEIHVYVYVAYDDEPVDMNENGDVDSTGSSSCTLLGLPNKKTEGLWESLIFDASIKVELLDYVSTAVYFSRNEVDQHLVAWNRVVLLYGPPGTGKVSRRTMLTDFLPLRLSAPEQSTLPNLRHHLFRDLFSHLRLPYVEHSRINSQFE